MLLELAATAVTRGQPARAILLSGAARSLEGKQGGGIAVHVLLHLAERINTAWDQLDPAQAEHAWDNGRLMSQQQAVAAALTDPQVACLPQEGEGGRARYGREEDD